MKLAVRRQGRGTCLTLLVSLVAVHMRFKVPEVHRTAWQFGHYSVQLHGLLYNTMLETYTYTGTRAPLLALT
jgi:hypothetical protein